jgi:hypothetical protein
MARTKPAPGNAEKRAGRISSVSTCSNPTALTRASSTKACCLAGTVGAVGEIGQDQPTSWFEYPGDLGESLALVGNGEMMDHQGGEDHIKRVIGEGKLLDHPALELDGSVSPGRFCAGAGELRCSWVNADHAARATHTVCHL